MLLRTEERLAGPMVEVVILGEHEQPHRELGTGEEGATEKEGLVVAGGSVVVTVAEKQAP